MFGDLQDDGGDSMVAPYKLHGVWLSGPTYKVGLMLSMTGQKFDYEYVNLREGAHQRPEYKAKNRFAVVPCLTVTSTGKNLCQAAAILGYLAQATGKFAGSSADEQQDIREWMLWGYDRLVPPIYRLRAAKAGFRKFDPATIEMYTAEGKVALKLLDDHLKGRDWVVGKSATIADIDLYGVAAYAAEGGFNLADYPNVQAWIKRFEALPGYGKPEAILPKETKAAA
jgi:glutathione S-transferase